MRRINVLGVAGLAVLLTVACGKSEEQKAAEQAAAEAQDAVKGLEDFAKAMEGMAGSLGGAPDGKPVDPVSFQQLQTVLPDVSGWQRGEPTGERITVPVSFSQAEATYTMGDANITVKVIDSAFSQMLIAPWAMFLTTGYERDTGSGYEKSVSVGGHPGFERWEKDARDGELNVVVAKRFMVTVEGHGISDTKVLHDFASKVDTSKLAAFK